MQYFCYVLSCCEAQHHVTYVAYVNRPFPKAETQPPTVLLFTIVTRLSLFACRLVIVHQAAGLQSPRVLRGHRRGRGLPEQSLPQRCIDPVATQLPVPLVCGRTGWRI